MDHIAYDQKYKTVECGRCGENVGYHRFLVSGICKDCAVEEDRMELSMDFTEEHDCHTSPEDGCDICEKIAHEAWTAQA